MGKATFAFVSKYVKNKDAPMGSTQFRFHATEIGFSSDTYEWLVVAHDKAVFKGSGVIDGAGNYGFMLSAIDADLTPSTDVDLFRIRIWDMDNADALVYDNQLGVDEDADPTTQITGGGIVIHKGKNKKVDDLANVPTEYALHGNWPNPFNSSTSITFDLPEASDVVLSVFDLLGREAARSLTGNWRRAGTM